MDKRYQVFVSSTYADLKKERQHVIQALMEMDCIPAGMELFPAADEEQWTFIQKVIDDCDYYLLIIGGRYGSTTDEGISYTEKEFDYAVANGLKVVALIHGKPEDISFGKSEKDPELREKLLAFKDKVMDGRLVKFWEKDTELPGLVALSLTKTIKMYPAVGWVRASSIANENVLTEMNEVRKKYSDLIEQNTILREQYESLNSQQLCTIDDIDDFDSLFCIHGKYKSTAGGYTHTEDFECELSWREIFALLSPYLVEHPNDGSVKLQLTKILFEKSGERGSSPRIDDQEFKTVTIQLKAYGLVSTKYSKTTKGGMALFWSLTEKGDQFMLESRIIKKNT
ncbi:DUF4062 domain-containing protein [Pontiellaceae bacterium B1224]|nr:DUF4062 domain-containing protein [Pontiellaceae bacterium B1224]